MIPRAPKLLQCEYTTIIAKPEVFKVVATASKAACRFYDANTGYAGGLHVSGHPVFGTRGIFKSQIVFDIPPANAISANVELPSVEPDKTIDKNLVNVFPMPARDIINVELPDAFVDAEIRISIHSMYGTVLQSTELSGAQSTQLNVSKLPAGTYVLRIVSGTQRIDKAISIID